MDGKTCGKIHVKLDSLYQQLSSTQKEEHNGIQAWTETFKVIGLIKFLFLIILIKDTDLGIFRCFGKLKDRILTEQAEYRAAMISECPYALAEEEDR